MTFRRAWVTGVDPESQQLLLAHGERVAFDVLLLALGARSRPVYPAFTTWRDNDADALAGLVRRLWCRLDRCGPRRHTNWRC